MGKYIHRFDSVEEFNDAYYESMQQVVTSSGLSGVSYEEYYVNTGFDQETGRYIWLDQVSMLESIETEDAVPDVENGFRAYFYQYGEWDYFDAEPGEYVIGETTEEKRTSKYRRPWLSATVGRGVDYDYHYEGVDLGLPSGTIWATTNIGARRPEDYGDYFKWGETEPNPPYIWTNYVYSGDSSGMRPSKYNDQDHLIELVPSDDAAHVVMGGKWEIPSRNDFQELIQWTNTAFTSINGVSGVSFTSKSDPTKSMFVPAAGGYVGPYDGGEYHEEFIAETIAFFLWAAEIAGNEWESLAYAGGEDGVDVVDVTDDMRMRSNGYNVRGIMKP